ncbi:MAG: hypothetical protein GYB31_12795 [Bacteroidetes bacterium]|nr:hypothetical protein [Bacteroidota bacterium]
MRIILALLLLVGLSTKVGAQIPDSVQTDTSYQLIVRDSGELDSTLTAPFDSSTVEKKRLFGWKDHPDYPKPKTALFLSLAVPGAGQVYSGKWWKVPIVYGALGGLGYLIDFNTNEYLRLKVAYKRKLRGVPHEFSDTYLDDRSTLKDLRDQSDKNRQLSYIGFVVVYMLNGAEAFVSAHLAHFDVDDDISIRIEPTFIHSGLGNTAGVGLKIRF